MQSCLYLSNWHCDISSFIDTCSIQQPTHSHRGAQPECVLFKVGLTFRVREREKSERESVERETRQENGAFMPARTGSVEAGSGDGSGASVNVKERKKKKKRRSSDGYDRHCRG